MERQFLINPARQQPTNQPENTYWATNQYQGLCQHVPVGDTGRTAGCSWQQETRFHCLCSKTSMSTASSNKSIFQRNLLNLIYCFLFCHKTLCCRACFSNWNHHLTHTSNKGHGCLVKSMILCRYEVKGALTNSRYYVSLRGFWDENLTLESWSKEVQRSLPA